MEQVAEKRCSTCGEVKPFGDFHRRSSDKPRVRSTCKKCASARKAKIYSENPERERLRSATWAAKNPEAVNVKRKRWKINNPEKVKLSDAKRRVEHSEKIKEYQRVWKSENPDRAKVLANRPCSELTDNYVSKLIGLPSTVIPAELIALKRINIQIKRQLRSKK